MIASQLYPIPNLKHNL